MISRSCFIFLRALLYLYTYLKCLTFLSVFSMHILSQSVPVILLQMVDVCPGRCLSFRCGCASQVAN